MIIRCGCLHLAIDRLSVRASEEAVSSAVAACLRMNDGNDEKERLLL